jgi:hypothetical protein
MLIVFSEEAMVASKEFITSVVVGKYKISTQSHSSGCPNKRRIGYIDTYKYVLDVLVLNLEMDRGCSSFPEGMENKSRGPTYKDFVTVRTEASMQDVTVARLQSTRVQTSPLPL